MASKCIPAVRYSFNNWYRDLAQPCPNFTGVKKCEIWRHFNITSESLNFEPPVFENAGRYLNSETNFLCSHDRPMSSPSLVK